MTSRRWCGSLSWPGGGGTGGRTSGGEEATPVEDWQREAQEAESGACEPENSSTSSEREN